MRKDVSSRVLSYRSLLQLLLKSKPLNLMAIREFRLDLEAEKKKTYIKHRKAKVLFHITESSVLKIHLHIQSEVLLMQLHLLREIQLPLLVQVKQKGFRVLLSDMVLPAARELMGRNTQKESLVQSEEEGVQEDAL